MVIQECFLLALHFVINFSGAKVIKTAFADGDYLFAFRELAILRFVIPLIALPVRMEAHGCEEMLVFLGERNGFLRRRVIYADHDARDTLFFHPCDKLGIILRILLKLDMTVRVYILTLHKTSVA